MANQPDKERLLGIGEHDYIGFLFWGDDLPAGTHIDAGTVTVTPGTGLTLGAGAYNITADQDGVYAWVTGVTAGEYEVVFTVNFSDTKTLIRRYRVTVI